ncbi:hypothetical protein NFI96_017221, partial [Prochilodus magdalenae]
IATAVKFLQNPKVHQSPLTTRKAFLKKKGLTDEEVELAIQRSGSTEETLARAPVGPPHMIQGPPLAPVPYSPPGYRWRDYGALAIIMAGMAFGFHHLYRKYILPLIMGSKEDKKHLQRIESSIIEMSGTLTQTGSRIITLRRYGLALQGVVSVCMCYVCEYKRFDETGFGSFAECGVDASVFCSGVVVGGDSSVSCSVG